MATLRPGLVALGARGLVLGRATWRGARGRGRGGRTCRAGGLAGPCSGSGTGARAAAGRVGRDGGSGTVAAPAPSPGRCVDVGGAVLVGSGASGRGPTRPGRAWAPLPHWGGGMLLRRRRGPGAPFAGRRTGRVPLLRRGRDRSGGLGASRGGRIWRRSSCWTWRRDRWGWRRDRRSWWRDGLGWRPCRLASYRRSGTGTRSGIHPIPRRAALAVRGPGRRWIRRHQMPQLNDLERALEDGAVMVGRDGGGIVAGVEDQDEAAVEMGPDQVDGLGSAWGREVDDDSVHRVGGQGGPALDGEELGDPAGAVEQRSEGETQRGVASEQHDMAGHPAGLLPGEDFGDAHDCGSQDHDEQGWEDTEEYGEQDLDGNLHRPFLGQLAAFDPHVLGLDA